MTIGAAGFTPSFAAVAAFPLVAAVIVPVAAERTAADPDHPAAAPAR